MKKKPVKHFKQNLISRILTEKERQGGQALGYRTLRELEKKHLI